MKVLCVSASNIEAARERSTSTRTCELVAHQLQTEFGDWVEVDILRLMDYELNPCRMCGKCFESLHCPYDPAFNEIFERLRAADAAFIVSPHYTPIPSKLVMLFEKLEEMVYLRTGVDPAYRFVLYGKPVGIIAHGGQHDDDGRALAYYKSALLDPIATALSAAQMKVIGAGEDWPYGVAFGVQEIRLPRGSIFLDILHDWDMVLERISPLVRNVALAALASDH
jgi:multimeric flavodoxin WrbA